MQIRALNLKNFMVPGRRDYALPECGVWLVTGPNGSGKSSLPEAVAAGVWGKSLRDDSGWIDGVDGFVFVEADSFDIERQRAGDKVKLLWSGGKYDTPSKCQDAVESQVGGFDEWRRTHVFSSDSAAHFTRSSDADRKRILELLIGLESFDRALLSCSSELSLAGARSTRAHVREAGARAAHVAAVHEVSRLLFRQAEEPEPAPVLVPGLDYAAARAAMDAEKRKLEEVESADKPAVTVSQACVLEAEARKDLWACVSRWDSVRLGVCTECGQPSQGSAAAAEDVLYTVQSAYVAAVEQRESIEQITERWLDRVARDRKAIGHAVGVFDARLSVLLEYERALVSHTRAEAARVARSVAADGELRDAQVRASEAELALSDAEDELLAAGAELSLLKVCSDALGLRGARVLVLAHALRGVEAVANHWMGRFFDDSARVRLDLSQESKSDAGRAGSVSFRVEGVGNGRYRSLSSGQKRRVDAAMLFALAECSSLASGRAPGTLWVDEVFDALDPSGVAAVQQAISEIAAHRCVVLITHSEELADGLSVVGRWRMGDV